MLVFQITIFEKKMSFHLITFTLFFPFMQYFVFKLMKKNLLCILLSPWMKNPVEKQIKSSSTTWCKSLNLLLKNLKNIMQEY